MHGKAATALVRRLMAVAMIGVLLLPAARHVVHEVDARRLEAPISGLEVPRDFVVVPGSSLQAVAAGLAAAELLDHPSSWVREARREGLAGRIRAGEYRVMPGSTPRQLLDMMVAGRVHLHALTVPEGWTYRQALAAVQAHPAVTSELADPADEELAALLGFAPAHPEGWFYPDTYVFPRGTTDVELLRQAHGRMREELGVAWQDREPGLPLADPYAALILASLIEKETGAADERPLIGGVFVNRLRRGMRLQTDPSVIYGLGEAFDGDLRRADLMRDTPYNTYTRGGLPPTPIALPGRAALQAAVRPAATDALYFVATGIGDGRHRFAATLSQHNDNVARYIAAVRGAGRDRAH